METEDRINMWIAILIIICIPFIALLITIILHLLHIV